ncbi:MAG: type II secretion system protein GspD, partial [Verrucomicrobium sp.]
AAPQGLAVYGHIGKHLNVFLRTLEQNKRFHVLQKPTVTALNHEEASIFIGQQLAIPGQTLTQGNTGVGGASVVSTTQYVPVRLQLDITPHIYANDEIRLDFNQQNMDIASYTEISGNRIPNISEQGMKNTIIVPNKSTVMMGGLITERDTKNKSGLPFLVRVPVLKHLFGNTSNSKERRELMIFVQPHILEDGVDHLNAQAEWAQGTNSYPVNKQFADSTIDTPVETNPPPAGKGIQSPILPLPVWQGDRSGAGGVSNDLPPPISPSTAAPAPRMITKKATSSSTKAQPPAAIPVAEEAGDAPVKQRASDRTRMLKK